MGPATGSPAIEAFATAAFEEAIRFATSLAIGLLIGLERERHPDAKAGVRTFALTSLLGAVSLAFGEDGGTRWLFLLGFVLVGAGTAMAYWRSTPQDADPGTTTVVAILLCYVYGGMVASGHSATAVSLAVVTTGLLYFKTELRGIAAAVTRRDLVSILQFGALAFVIYPLLPDEGFGPKAVLNLRQLWLMVVLISGISLAGYLALRIVGTRYGALLTGFLGGLVSSTATTLAYARRAAATPGAEKVAAHVVVVANTVVCARLLLLAVAVGPDLVARLVPILGTGFAVGAVFALAGARRGNAETEVVVPEVKNPTEIGASLLFGATYGLVLLLSAWSSAWAGERGLYALAMVSGLTDVDAITLSSLRMQGLGGITPEAAVTAITLAFNANMLFKGALVVLVGGRRLSRLALPGLAAMAAGTVIAGALTRG